MESKSSLNTSQLIVGGVNIEEARLNRINHIYDDSKEITSSNMEFVLKYLTEHMPKSAGIIKMIAADEKKIFDI